LVSLPKFLNFKEMEKTIMDKYVPIEGTSREQTLHLAAFIKANAEEFHDYVMSKPQRHKESVERMKKERQEQRKKALNEWLSV
jgi:hypothetical protein